MKSFKQLLAAWHAAATNSTTLPPPTYTGPDIALLNLVEHTDDVQPGSAFVARVRVGTDGHRFIGQAIEHGVSLILAQRSADELGLTVPENVAYLVVPDTAEALAWLAAAWYDFPARHLTVIGVTGTDGKTSTSNLLFAILRQAGLQVGLLSTIKAVIGLEEEPLALHVTTPEAPVVQSYLRRMVDAGLTHCVLETTSHALAQHRVTGIEYAAAVYTNITHEHLDYHGNYDNYLATKARLVSQLRPGGVVILNRDDQSYERLREYREQLSVNSEQSPVTSNQLPVTRDRLTYGIHHPADVTATDITYSAAATQFTLCTPQLETRNSKLETSITSPLVGEFNIYNMLAAATLAYHLGLDSDTIKAGLESVTALNGRMERIDRGQAFLVIVDFAHTPNALEKAIQAVRGMGRGRVIVVFGSAGKRDKEKRRLMAEIAGRDADLSILTAEDPRTESLDDILAMMAEGCRSQGGVEEETFWRVPDRGRAIYHALTLAHPNDIVLICGKGHEQSMCFGTIEYPWDDRDATRAALDACLTGQPLPDLGLPTFRPPKSAATML